MTVLDITVGGSEDVGSDTENVLDDFLGPPKFRNNFLGCLGSQSSVGPRVDGDLGDVSIKRLKRCAAQTDLMSTHVLALEVARSGDDPRADNKEGGLETLLVKVLDEIRGIWRWAIIEAA